MKRLLAVLGLLLGALVLAALLLPYLVPQSYVQRQLGRLLAQETGLYLQDAQRLRLSLFPSLGIAVEGVSARLPANFGRAPIIRADRIFTAIKPLSLFARRIALSKVTIENPSLQFHIDASGRSDWDLTELSGGPARIRLADLGDSTQIIKTAAHGHGESVRPTALPSIDIDVVNGSFAYSDDVHRRKLQIADVNLALHSSGGNGPVTVDGGLSLQGEPISLSATATPPTERSDRSAALRFVMRSEAVLADLSGILLWHGKPQFSGSARLDMHSGVALARWAGGNAGALSRFDGSEIGGRLELSGDELILSDASVTAPGAKGDLAVFVDFDGMVRANLQNLALHGGMAQGKLTLDARQPEAVLAGSFEMSNVDSLSLAKGASGFDWLSGRATAKIEVAGGGKSIEAIAQTLTGSGRLTVADGAIEGIDLPLVVAEAKNGEFKKWRREAGRRTPFTRLEASFTIDKGLARTNDLTLTGPDIAATGEGKTDLVRGRLDYRLKPKITAKQDEAAPADKPQQPGQQEVASLAIPLVVKGDWDKPDIYPDIENALKDTDSIAGTAKLFGKSVEKLTDGQIKADDFDKAIDSLFGKKKKKKDRPSEAE
ncbi:MAG: AsmA family protein [Rhodomicrobiaceae bacterium]